MEPKLALSKSRIAYIAICLLLIVVSLGRLAAVVPHWLTGELAAYPGQYARRLFSTLFAVPIMSAVILMRLNPVDARSQRRRLVVGMLLAISVVSAIIEIIRDAAQ